tara:strand:- start:130 stop:330 length:201 start_codon:yes stop_codon:yes gene_type:complete
MKLNKNLRRVIITMALIGAGFAFGKQQGEQEILNRWEDRWFDSEWYDYRSIEDILYEKDYSIELGE